MIDELDRSILQEYLKDARQSYHQIAKKLEVSPSTVQDRTRKLEENGVIKGYTVMLDYEKLGMVVAAITEISTTGGGLTEVEKRLAQMPGANAVYDVTGATDAIVLSKFRSTAELSRFCKAVQAIPHVVRSETHVVLSVVKEGLPKI